VAFAISAVWRAFRDFRRLAALVFFVLAGSTGIVCAGASLLGPDWAGGVLMFLACFLTFPFLVGLGAAWATASTRRNTRRRRSPLFAWPLAVILALLPVSMLITFWPFRLAFLASENALSRLADQVAAGNAPQRPVWAGVFRIVGSAIDPATGNVALVTDADPAGRAGFVRYRLGPGGVPVGPGGGPLTNLNGSFELRHGWRFECED
jgi:hypothetical protein